MAKVPFTNYNSTQELAAGSEVQLGATDVIPQRDVVSGEIKKMAQSQQQLGQTINKIDDQLNDAEAKTLYNELHTDIQNATSAYTNLKGAQAVLPNGKIDGENTTAYDDTNKNLEAIVDAYDKRASNGVVKHMVRKMALVSTKSAQFKITEHALLEEANLKKKETEAKIDNHKTDAIKSITRFNDPSSTHWVAFGSGIREIQSYAIDQKWNIDPSKGPVSEQYLKMIKDYTKEVHEAAVKWFKDGDQKTAILGQKYFAAHAQGFNIGGQQLITVDGITLVKSLAELKKSEDEYCAVKICNNVLEYEGNSNDNTYLSEMNFLLKLDSNNNIDNGNGSSVIDGNNADLMPNINASKSELIENLQQARGESIYYNVDSPKYEQIIPQHRTGHLYAIQRFGVKKADSMYTKAIKDANIDRERYNNDQKYFVEINKTVMKNFNKSFLAEIDNAYTPKVQELTKKLEKLEEKNSRMKSKGVYEEKKRKLKAEIKTLKEDIKVVKNQAGTYVKSVSNDLLVINEDIDYEYVHGKEYVKVNAKTNLPPLTYYENQIKKTIFDPVKQETALTELRFKYNKMDKERTENYDIAYTQAEDIAFSEPDGWKMLKANGIDINSFTVEDQKKLKGGQPEESDENALDEIEENDVEILQDETKLKAFRHKLAPGDYEYYVNQLNGNKTNKAKSAGLKVDSLIFEEGLDKHNLSHLVGAKQGSDEKMKYRNLKKKYRDRLNFYYENGVEITYDKRQQILKEILVDDVMFDKGFWGGTAGVDTKRKVYEFEEGSDDFDRLYVKVDDATIYLKEIPLNVRTKISRQLFISGEALSSEAIANEWVDKGKPKNTDAYENAIKIEMMRGY